MTSLTLVTLLVMAYGVVNRGGYGRALALGGATAAGAAIALGGVAMPTFYVTAIGAAGALVLALLGIGSLAAATARATAAGGPSSPADARMVCSGHLARTGLLLPHVREYGEGPCPAACWLRHSVECRADPLSRARNLCRRLPCTVSVFPTGADRSTGLHHDNPVLLALPARGGRRTLPRGIVRQLTNPGVHRDRAGRRGTISRNPVRTVFLGRLLPDHHRLRSLSCPSSPGLATCRRARRRCRRRIHGLDLDIDHVRRGRSRRRRSSRPEPPWQSAVPSGAGDGDGSGHGLHRADGSDLAPASGRRLRVRDCRRQGGDGLVRRAVNGEHDRLRSVLRYLWVRSRSRSPTVRRRSCPDC